MSWQTPTLATVRANNRDYITGKLGIPLIPNDVPRVLADANGGNAHLALQYLDWLSRQFLPDTAEQVFLDKWATLFLLNADGTRGRKVATYSNGAMTVTGVAGTPLPQYTLLTAQSGTGTLTFQTTAAITIGASATQVPVRALTAGSIGNLATGSRLSLVAAIPGVDAASGTVVSLSGGTDGETDDELRVRVLARLRQPPMGGDADDYDAWALEVPGVTRAWCSPREQGPGTVTVRFMMDDLRATSNPTTSGFPNPDDVATVQAYIDLKRPATADVFVVAPAPQLISFTVTSLTPNTVSTQAAVNASVAAMLLTRAAPARSLNGEFVGAQKIFAAWVSEAISAVAGVVSFDLTMGDVAMSDNGRVAVLGTPSYV